MLTDKFKKPKGPVLDESLASQMLENIFDACEVEPNTVPLSVLTSYSNYRRERFLLQKVLLVIILLFFCLAPLMFIAPDIDLNLKDQTRIRTGSRYIYTGQQDHRQYRRQQCSGI